MDLDPSTTIQEIYDYLQDSGIAREYTHLEFLFIRKKNYSKPLDTIGNNFQRETILIDFAKSGIVEIHTQVQLEGKIIQNYQLEFDDQTTISKIIEFIQESQELKGNGKILTCFSKEKGRFCGYDEISGFELKKQTLIIDISEHNLNTETKKLDANISQEIQFCKIHNHCQIRFISLEKHNCQRRLCADCQLDSYHKEIQIPKFLPLNQFKEKLKAQAEITLKNNIKYQNLQKKMENIQCKLQEQFNSLKKSIEKAFQQFNDSFKTATDILNNLRSSSILNNSNDVVQKKKFTMSCN